MEAQFVDGDFDNRCAWHHGQSTDADRFLLLDHAFTMAIYTGEEPITPGAAALMTSIKHWHLTGTM